MINLIKNKKID